MSLVGRFYTDLGLKLPKPINNDLHRSRVAFRFGLLGCYRVLARLPGSFKAARNVLYLLGGRKLRIREIS